VCIYIPMTPKLKVHSSSIFAVQVLITPSGGVVFLPAAVPGSYSTGVTSLFFSSTSNRRRHNFASSHLLFALRIRSKQSKDTRSQHGNKHDDGLRLLCYWRDVDELNISLWHHTKDPRRCIRYHSSSNLPVGGCRTRPRSEPAWSEGGSWL
jgi:hypothetical protein